MASLAGFNSGGRGVPVAGIVLVSRGDERRAPTDDDVPQPERLGALLASFGAGGCRDLYVALGSRVVAAPRDSSTTFYLPEWYDALDATAVAALGFAAGRNGFAGVLVQTVDSQDLGDVGVARILTAAAGRSDVVVHAVCDGRRAQPVYIGADLTPDAAARIAKSGGTLRFLGEYAREVVPVDCSDLAGPGPDPLV